MMIAAPILVPMITAVLLLFIRRKSVLWQQIAGIAGAVAMLIFHVLLLLKARHEGIVVMHVGEWKAPAGIPLVIDQFSGIMLVISGIVAVCVSVYSVHRIDVQRHSFRYYFFFHTLLLGVNGAFITGDIFNLFVWFEVMLMSSFALIALGNEKQQLENSMKYIIINLVSSFLLLAAIGLLYSVTGTLNMAHLAQIVSNDASFLTESIIMLLFIALAIKAALFPFYYWLPASYHSPPAAITAFFAALLTKVGVYVLIRVFTLFYPQLNSSWTIILLVTAGFTMLVGAVAALSQTDIRRILSFEIISQIGYMIMGLGLFTKLAIAGAIYFIAHNVFAKTNVFLVEGLIYKLQGTHSLKKTGGLLNARTGLAVLFFIPALGLAGVPPLSGFFGKLILVKASFESSQVAVAVVALLVSLLTLYLMLRIWHKAFLKEDNHNERKEPEPLTFTEVVPVVFLALLTVIMGIGAAYIFNVCFDAAEQLLNSESYINSVLNHQQ